MYHEESITQHHSIVLITLTAPFDIEEDEESRSHKDKTTLLQKASNKQSCGQNTKSEQECILEYHMMEQTHLNIQPNCGKRSQLMNQHGSLKKPWINIIIQIIMNTHQLLQYINILQTVLAITNQL